MFYKDIRLTMVFQHLELFLFLYPVHLQCKLILLSNASELVHNEESHAQLLNSSLQRFDNFTLCGRYISISLIITIQTFSLFKIPHLQLLDVI